MLYFLAICIFLLVLFAALLFYVTREQTFEQALEEQRNKHDDLLTPTNIITGDNNDKIGRKDRAKKLNLNKKSTKTVANKQQNVSNKIQPKSNNNEKVVVSSSVDVVSSAAEESNESKVLKLDDHRKSKESISTVTAPAATAAVATANAIPLSVPEDKVDAVVVPVVERPIKANQSIKNQSSAKIPVVKQDNSTVAINKPNNNSSNNVPVTNGKKSKKSNVSKVSRDFNMNDIIEIIKSFTKEEVTDLTDHLLTIQANDQSINDLSWHTKNDPVESLRKQLAEKEETINTQKINLENSKRRFDMINTELKTSKFRLQNECRMRQEIENQKNNFARLLAEMEKNGKQQLEKLIEKNRITRQEEFARHNTIVADMKNEINKMQIQLMEKEKMLAEMQELRNVKMNQEENLKNLTEKYQAEIGYLKEDHSKMVNENDQLKAQIETLKQSLKMAEENSIPVTDDNNEKLLKEIAAKLQITYDDDVSNDQFLKSIDELKTAKEDCKKFEDENKKLKDESEKSQKEVQHLRDDLNASSKDSSKKLQSMIEDKEKKEKLLKEIAAKFQIKDDKFSDDQLLKSIDESKTVKEDYKRFEDENKKLSDEIQQLKKELNTSKDSVTKLQTTINDNKKNEQFLKDVYSKFTEISANDEGSSEKLLKSIEELKTTKENCKKIENENAKLKEEDKKLIDEIRQLQKDLITSKDLTTKLQTNVDCNKKKDQLLNDVFLKFEIKNDGDDNSGDKLLKTIDELVRLGKQMKENSSKSNEEMEKLRKENENLKQKLDVIENDRIRFKNSFEDVDKKLQKVEKDLIEEQKSKQVELNKKEQQLALIQKDLKEKHDSLNLCESSSKTLKSDLDKTNELLKEEQKKYSRIQIENDQKTTILEQIQQENRDLKKKNDKLNELVQIGVQTYQEENRKVLDLEQRLASCKPLNSNGDNNACPTTTNGN